MIIDYHLPAVEILENLRPIVEHFKTFEKVHLLVPRLDSIIIDFCNAFIKACEKGFYNPDSFPQTEYEDMFGNKRGDFNWIIYKRLLALSTPGILRLMAPKLLAPTLKEIGVKILVRLCQSYYEPDLFNQNGIKCEAIQYPDGGTPNDGMIRKWLQITSQKDIVIGVHCMAGIGRTGTMCAIYLMKYEGFKADEAFWYIRSCRPFSIEAGQLEFLRTLDGNL